MNYLRSKSLLLLMLPPALAMAQEKPNVVLILADDLGYNELSCNGQQKFSTPNIDRLSKEGITFTQHYSGSPVSAPSRCSLLTGMHTGHAYIRDNKEVGAFHEYTGQMPLADSCFTLAEMLKKSGYATACIGKWGLGFNGNSGDPVNQGFEHFFGYLCQRQGHNYYPEYLWRNGKKVLLNNPSFSPHQQLTGNNPDSAGFAAFTGNEYSQQLMVNEALHYIGENNEKPFFLFLTFTLPHLALQAPPEKVEKFRTAFADTPYDGSDGYLPSRFPRATYAAMISLLDDYVGVILNELKNQGLDENTIVIFTSDNGATFNTGGADTKFFGSNDPFRGYKQDLYDGGIHVPFMVRWKGTISPGQKSDLICGFQDIMPTLAGISKSQVPENLDGISLLPTLLDEGKQRKHKFLYWEYHSNGGSQAIRYGKWKAVKRNIRNQKEAEIELYNLELDPGETNNVASENIRLVRKMEKFLSDRTQSVVKEWNFE